MEEILISHKTAKLAKEKGLPCENGTYYNPDNEDQVFNWWTHAASSLEKNKLKMAAPTQTSLQTWLREEHDIIVLVGHVGNIMECDDNKPYYWYIIGHNIELELDDYFNKFEDALEEGLYKALGLIKSNEGFYETIYKNEEDAENIDD